MVVAFSSLLGSEQRMSSVSSSNVFHVICVLPNSLENWRNDWIRILRRNPPLYAYAVLYSLLIEQIRSLLDRKRNVHIKKWSENLITLVVVSGRHRASRL